MLIHAGFLALKNNMTLSNCSSWDGNRIAKRGHPGTPQAATWIPLEPGYSVSDDEDPKTIIPTAKNERTRAAAMTARRSLPPRSRLAAGPRGEKRRLGTANVASSG